MSEEEKIVVAGKVPRKKKTLYFLRFYAWSVILIGIVWAGYTFHWFLKCAIPHWFEHAPRSPDWLYVLYGFMILLGFFAWWAVMRAVARIDEKTVVLEKGKCPWAIRAAQIFFGFIAVGCVIGFGFLSFISIILNGSFVSLFYKNMWPLTSLILLGLWLSIGLCSFWGAIGRIMGKAERAAILMDKEKEKDGNE